MLYNTEDDLFRYLKDLLTGETRPLPKASLQSINKHLDWSQRIEKYDSLFDECRHIEIKPALSHPASGFKPVV